MCLRCCSVALLSPTLCNPMDCNTPGLPVPHHLLEFDQVHVHCIGDAIQLSHPLMPSSPSSLNLSQHQGHFQWVVCLHQMTKILELQLQHQSFQWICSPMKSRGLSGVVSSTTVWRYQSFGILPSLQSSSHNCMWPLGSPWTLTMWTFVSRVMSLLLNTLSRFCISVSSVQSLSRVQLFVTSRTTAHQASLSITNS